MKAQKKKQKNSQKNFMNIKTKPLKKKELSKKKEKKNLQKGVTNKKKNVEGRRISLNTETVPTVGEQVISTQIPKIRRTAVSENVEENFIIVPWASREEWDDVCAQFHEEKYVDVVAKIAVWQSRVPTLPVGVEATLFLLEALIYDNNSSSNVKVDLYTEDQARSLYSFAIIRYLNHVSQLAAQSVGRSSQMLTRELAAIVDTPEWLVSLRNDVSHSPTAPSIEVLRMGGDYVLQWLKEKYWKLPEEISTSANCSDLFTISTQDEVINYSQLSELFAAFIAARIYKLRRYRSVNDPDIVRYLSSGQSSVKPKEAIINLKTSLRRHIESHPSLFCTIVSQELIPNPEFYEDFKVMLKLKEEDQDIVAFDKLYFLWTPIVKLLESKGKLIFVLKNLASIVTNKDMEKMWTVAARWIDKLLERIEASGKKRSKYLVDILEVVIKQPNCSMQYFLQRLFRMTEPRLGSEAVQKLAYLAAIWIEEHSGSKKIRKNAKFNLFTLNDIQEPNTCQSEEIDVQLNNERHESIAWMSDDRGEDFWRNLPIGVVL